ncbi:unnamed protein product [Calypogeia fissa]
MKSKHFQVMKKVTEKDLSGALPLWDDFDARVCGYYDRGYFLLERGILKRMVGDVNGALEDLTVELKYDWNDYERSKHRGYVKFLLGDTDGARKDAKRCLAMGLQQADYDFLAGYLA